LTSFQYDLRCGLLFTGPACIFWGYSWIRIARKSPKARGNCFSFTCTE